VKDLPRLEKVARWSEFKHEMNGSEMCHDPLSKDPNGQIFSIPEIAVAHMLKSVA
jgi:hypothetical protein